MKKIILTICTILALYSCNNNEDLYDHSSSLPSLSKNIINKSGKIDGVDYTFDNVEVNPNLVILNSKNSKILSSQDEMSKGIFRLEVLSEDLTKELISGNTIYLITDENTYIKNITSVYQSNSIYDLQTTDASIGDIFKNGSLKISLSSTEPTVNNNSLKAVTNSFDRDYIFKPIIFDKEFKFDGISFNPNTLYTSALSIKLGFTNTQKFPNKVEMIYQTNLSINPHIKFEKAINKKLKHDFVEQMPNVILDQIKKIEVGINIPTGSFLGDIPVRISINQINFPTELEANIQNKSYLSYNFNRSLKIGFKYCSDPNEKNTFIYDNSVNHVNEIDSDLTGEATTNMEISIIPNIKVFDSNLIDINGKIILGVNTYNIGNVNISQSPKSYSKGHFHSSALFSFGSLGIPVYSTDIFKKSIDLWEIGEFERTMNFSNFIPGNASILPCNGLTSYGYDVFLNYKYPISGKLISENLEMTYDVYADNGAILELNKKIKIYPKDITANSFKFPMCIPFRKIGLFNTAKTSYLKNITIKDANGYVANGISDPISDILINEIKLTR